MAFGSTLKDEKKAVAGSVVDGGSTYSGHMPIIPLQGTSEGEHVEKGGRRTIRLLPVVSGGELVLSNGKPFLEQEYSYLEVWLEVNIDGKKQNRTIKLDPDKPWDNPYWKLVASLEDPGSPKRRQPKKVAMNVWNRTKVIKTEHGFVYPNSEGQYLINEFGKLLDKPAEGDEVAADVIDVLICPSGMKNGKHMFQQLVNALDGYESPDGRLLDGYEFDLQIRISGKGKLVTRTVSAWPNFQKIPDHILFAPRYDLKTWTKPWPDDAVTAVINGADYNEVIKEFNIPTQLVLENATAVADEEDLF